MPVERTYTFRTATKFAIAEFLANRADLIFERFSVFLKFLFYKVHIITPFRGQLLFFEIMRTPMRSTPCQLHEFQSSSKLTTSPVAATLPFILIVIRVP